LFPWFIEALSEHNRPADVAPVHHISDEKRFPWILYGIAFVLIVLVAVAPVGSVVACGLIANAHDCPVDEGSVDPCIIGGHDYGQLPYTLGVMGWLMLVALPGGALALVTWLIVLILHHASWRRRFSADSTGPPAIRRCVSAT
jgi:hypothetical protein